MASLREAPGDFGAAGRLDLGVHHLESCQDEGAETGAYGGRENTTFFLNFFWHFVNSSEPINRLAFQSNVWLLEATSNMFSSIFYSIPNDSPVGGWATLNISVSSAG